MRRLLLLLVAAVATLATLSAAPAFAAAPPDGSGDTTSSSAQATTTTIDNSFLDTKRDITECLNNSINLPDCGTEPKSAGDRGGALQAATFGVLAAAIAFITWRVTKAIRARDKELASHVT